MVSGRLREHDRNQIALDLIEWAQKDDSLNLNAFCALKMLPPSKISQWAKEDDFFRQAYEMAKAHVGARREECLRTGRLHVKAYDLNAPVYDYFLKEERRLQAEFESRLKQEEQATVKEEDKVRFDAIMNQLSSLQSASNQATSKVSNVDKS